jgi:hypothetical protein
MCTVAIILAIVAAMALIGMACSDFSNTNHTKGI